MKILKQKVDIFGVVLIIIFGLWQLRHLWAGYWFSSHDAVFHVLRVEEMFKMVKMGFFPVRWGLNLDNGFGVPIFNYVYPGPHYLAVLFSWFGLSSLTSVRLVFTFFYILGGLGFYFIFKKRNRWLAIMAGLIYMLLPYQFLDIFVRGSFGEVGVLGLAPMVLVAINDLKKNKLSWYHPIPLALMFLCHNFLSVLFFGWLIFYIFFNRLLTKRVLGSVLVSIGLVSFFLIPMIGERKLISSGRNNEFTYDYKDHFVYPNQLIYSKWDYWYSGSGADDGMSFQLGLTSILIVGLALVKIIIADKNRGSVLAYYLVSYFGVIFLMLPYSNFIWQKIAILQIIQFPWRFLFLTTFLTPLLLGFIYKNNKVLLIFLLGIALINSRNYKRPQKNWNENEYLEIYNLYKDGLTTTGREQVAPYWSIETPYKTMDIEGVESKWVGKELFFELNGEDIQEVVANFNYFPAWELVSGQTRIELYPTEKGRIGFVPLSGKQTYVLRLGSTKIEKFSNFISVVSVIVVVGLGLTRRKSRI